MVANVNDGIWLSLKEALSKTYNVDVDSEEVASYVSTVVNIINASALFSSIYDEFLLLSSPSITVSGTGGSASG